MALPILVPSIHDVANGLIRSNESRQLQHIIKRCWACSLSAETIWSPGSIHSPEVFRLEALPDSPDAVEVGVVQIEDGIVDCGPWLTHLTANGGMSTNMQASWWTWCWETHPLGHVVVADLAQDREDMLLPLKVAICKGRIEVADDAVRDGLLKVEVRSSRVVIVFEGSVGDATAGKEWERVVWRRRTDGVIWLTTTGCVSAKASNGVKDWRVVVEGAIVLNSVQRPVPVWLSTLVATFIDECSFVLPDNQAVPW